MKITILDAKTMGTLDEVSVIKTCGDVTIYQETKPEDRLKNIADSEVIVTNKVIIDKTIMDACLNLKLVCLTATGMNNVDLEYAKLKNIQVKNVAGYSTESVAQTTFAVVLELVNKISFYNTYVKSGEYSKQDSFTYLGHAFSQLKGKTWGIIGLGTIGKRVAEIAQVFGCNIVYYSTSGKNNNADFQQLSLEKLLSVSDIVSIHAPLNAATTGLIGAKELAYMKNTALLINMGRGGIVKEPDLAVALQNNQIAGAGLDVMEKEPLELSNPLLKIDSNKLIILPHIAWSSVEARKRLLELTVENIKSYK